MKYFDIISVFVIHLIPSEEDHHGKCRGKHCEEDESQEPPCVVHHVFDGGYKCRTNAETPIYCGVI